MKNFVRILFVLFCILILQTLIAESEAITFVFMALGAIIMLIADAKYFGIIRGTLVWLIFLLIPGLIIYFLKPFTFANHGIELWPSIPLAIPFFFLILINGGIFFSRYIILSKTAQMEWYKIILAIVATIVFGLLGLLMLPALAVTITIINVSAVNYLQWLLLGFICYLLAGKLLKFRISADIYYIKTASLIFVLMAVYYGLINLKAGYYVPAAISLFFLLIYLCQKYNFYKIGKLKTAKLVDIQ